MAKKIPLKAHMLVYTACHHSGLMKLGRWLIRRSGPRLIILNYHRASGDLRSHMIYLRRHFRLMHLEEALEELYTPRKKKEGTGDRRSPLVLTFDDGHRDNYTSAFKLACELQIPITVFLIPGYVESNRCFWWMAGEHLLRLTSMSEARVAGRVYHLKVQEERQALLQVIDAHQRYATSVAEREEFLAEVCQALGVSQAALALEEPVLSWMEIREMEASGWVSFGGHTMHHPVLGYLMDITEVQREIRESYSILEQQLGHQVRIFAYPIGQVEHICEGALQAIRETGYSWAVTTIYGLNTPRTDPHQLRRISMDACRHWLVVASSTSGIERFAQSLFRLKTLLSRKNRSGSQPGSSQAQDLPAMEPVTR
jgi:peptidoglycan/xylan/chitin deacetylase (PgdA/CDA1 family)